MTRKLCYVLFIIAILLGLTSCGFVEEAKHVDDWLPKVKKDSEIIIYDKCRQKICVYDTKKMEIVSENNTENFFQFEFRDGGNYFTSGHSIHNGFKIFSLFQNKRDVVHALSGIEHEAIFPFARMDEDKYFFVKYYYDENGVEIPALFVIDARTKEVIGKADDVIDFKVQDGKIIVYCHGHIDIIER